MEDKLGSRLKAWIEFWKLMELPDISDLPKYVGGLNAEEIRKISGVQELKPLEEQLPLDEIPDGRYGFTVPWSLTNDRRGGIRRISMSLDPKRGGTAQMEVHKVTSEAIYMVAYLTKNDSERVRDNTKGEVQKVVASFSVVDEFDTPVAVPVSRIIHFRERSVTKYGYICDITLR